MRKKERREKKMCPGLQRWILNHFIWCLEDMVKEKCKGPKRIENIIIQKEKEEETDGVDTD